MMNMKYILPTTMGDVYYLAETIAPDDLNEVVSGTGMDVLQALQVSVLNTTYCFTFFCPDGTFGGIFGVSKQDDDKAIIWMLGSENLQRFPKVFLKESRKWVRHFQTIYPVLYNYVDSRHTRAIRWLQWLGFVLINKHEAFGVDGTPFYEFVRI